MTNFSFYNGPYYYLLYDIVNNGWLACCIDTFRFHYTCVQNNKNWDFLYNWDGTYNNLRVVFSDREIAFKTAKRMSLSILRNFELN